MSNGGAGLEIERTHAALVRGQIPVEILSSPTVADALALMTGTSGWQVFTPKPGAQWVEAITERPVALMHTVGTTRTVWACWTFSDTEPDLADWAVLTGADRLLALQEALTRVRQVGDLVGLLDYAFCSCTNLLSTVGSTYASPFNPYSALAYQVWLAQPAPDRDALESLLALSGRTWLAQMRRYDAHQRDYPQAARYVQVWAATHGAIIPPRHEHEIAGVLLAADPADWDDILADLS